MILAIDLSDSFLSLSFRQNQQEVILFKRQLNHMELSPHILHYLLQTEGIHLQSIQRLAMISGPGNYTGLRAGTVLMRSLSMHLNVPIWQLTRIEALVFACQEFQTDVWISQFVRMNQYYFAKGHYHKINGFTFACKPQTGSADALNQAWTHSPAPLIGDWTNTKEIVRMPRISPVSALALWCEKTEKTGLHWSEVHPFYIRPAVN